MVSSPGSARAFVTVAVSLVLLLFMEGGGVKEGEGLRERGSEREKKRKG